ncbi:MAG TPA: hypothetical protein VIL69_14750 [Roseomonas sp.]
MPDRRFVLPALVLAAAACVHLATLHLMLNPRVGPEYKARFIDQSTECLEVPPPPVLEALPAQLPVRGASRPRCSALLPLGWHPAEDWGVWSASPRATLAFTLAPGVQPAELRLVLHLHGAEQHPRSLTILVNGAPAMTERLTHADPVEITIPGTRLPAGATHRVTLRLDRLYSPRRLGTGQDTRPLGIALHEASLR